MLRIACYTHKKSPSHTKTTANIWTQAPSGSNLTIMSPDNPRDMGSSLWGVPSGGG